VGLTFLHFFFSVGLTKN